METGRDSVSDPAMGMMATTDEKALDLAWSPSAREQAVAKIPSE
jgi:hypothetical protein